MSKRQKSPPAARKASRRAVPKLPLRGGCHCGALRYRVSARPKTSGYYCHCRICQRTTGAPAIACFGVPVGAFSYVKGAPAIYKSSSWGQREFCRTCGAQILYRNQRRAREVSINTATLDKPAVLAPLRHIYDESRIPWFDAGSALPRSRKFG